MTVFVARALVRAASRLISTPVFQPETVGQTIVLCGLPLWISVTAVYALRSHRR
jgi:hypothetical protein